MKYGFAVLRDCVDRQWAKDALQRLRHHVIGEGRDLPFDQWTTKNVRLHAKVPGDPFLDAVYDQPNVRDLIATMYGTREIGVPTGWSGKHDYQIFLNPFSPDAKQEKLWGGHIDFGGNIIPLFGNAFVMQVALHDTEPHGGNITITPGSHRLVQKRTIENKLTQYPYDFEDFPFTEPYEFVAKAGDVLLMHHLSFHTGNPCCGATRKPRLALHCQVHRSTFLTRADPSDPRNPPWVRSFTLNGFVEDPDDEQRYIRFCEAKKAIWGVWSTEDGRSHYKVYTYSDGCLRAKIREAGAGERVTERARFDGQRFTFDRTLPFPIPKDGDATPCAPTAIEADLRDKELAWLIVRSAAGERRTPLRRTQAITTRLHE